LFGNIAGGERERSNVLGVTAPMCDGDPERTLETVTSNAP
jgi:hypothetical protein